MVMRVETMFLAAVFVFLTGWLVGYVQFAWRRELQIRENCRTLAAAHIDAQTKRIALSRCDRVVQINSVIAWDGKAVR